MSRPPSLRRHSLNLVHPLPVLHARGGRDARGPSKPLGGEGISNSITDKSAQLFDFIAAVWVDLPSLVASRIQGTALVNAE